MPRYEFQDAKSHKFWEIEPSGNTFTVRYGRVGSDGQSSTKVFDSAEKATAEADKLTRSKVKKGYALVQAAAAPQNPGHDLVQAILDQPDDEGRWMVYADWLVEQGDARGALINAYARGDDPTELHEAHQKAWMGRFATDLDGVTTFEWRNGFWHSARPHLTWDAELPDDVPTMHQLVGRILRHPSAAFLHTLRIGLSNTEGEANWQESIDALVKHGVRPSIRTLFVGDFERPDDTEISWANIGTLAHVWSVLPNLEDLTVQGASIGLGHIEAPNLRVMRLWSGGLDGGALRSVSEATLPALTDLEIWLGTDDYGGNCVPGDAEGILSGQGLPALERLGLMNYSQADLLVPLVVHSAILPRLRELDLSMGTLTDEAPRHSSPTSTSSPT